MSEIQQPTTGDKPSDPFQTGHLASDLKQRSVRGGAVTLTAQAVKFVTRLGTTAVLARLLLPEDFGLVAMVTAITGFVAMFKDAGLSLATVQREEITHEQVSTLFWVNVALSAVLMAITAALAPAIAWFYGEPRLALITVAIAATFIIGGFTAQHHALLRRQMRFRTLAMIEIASMVIGAVVAVALAAVFDSYWALVFGPASGTLVTAIGAWFAARWVPGPPRWATGVWPMLAFGGGITVSSVANYSARHADNVLLGRFAGSYALGIYTKAYSLLLMPLREADAVISSVVVPVLCRVEKSRFARTVTAFHKYYALLTVPSIAGLFVFADAVILTVLGPDWEEAILVFRILCVVSFNQAISRFVGWVLISSGDTAGIIRYNVTGAVFAVAAFFVGVQWGLYGLATALAIQNTIWTPILVEKGLRASEVRVTQYLGALLPSLAGIGLAGALALIPYHLAPYELVWKLGALALCPLASMAALVAMSEDVREYAKSLAARPFQSLRGDTV